jgi:hypothetical protein
VAYVHNRLIESLFSGDLEQAQMDWDSHLENGDFNRRAKISWQRRLNATERKG